MQDCTLFNAKVSCSVLLLVVRVHFEEICVCVSQYVTGYHASLIYVLFYPMTHLSFQDVLHCSPASYDRVKMRMAPKMTALAQS